MSKAPSPATLGALRESNFRSRSVKDELREHVRTALAGGQELFPGIRGYAQTVEPELINALLSRHDLILLGLRGQAKTRILRLLPRFLDEWMPALADTPLPEDPFSPITPGARRLLEKQGDDAAIRWVHREDRFVEKLATPDVSMADLIGDIDPIKASREGLSLDDPEVITYGLVARAHRGIFVLNELPDLAPRIQVGLLNILEEKDIQVRGFPLRLPLDLCMAFTANPEDYTNRGSIITPLKDRIDSQVQTHYPRRLEDAMQITTEQAWTDRGQGSEDAVQLPGFVRRIVDESVLMARQSEHVDASSGVSARASIAALECLHSNVERRQAMLPGSSPMARVADLDAIIPALVGKIELAFEGEQEGSWAVCRDLVGKAIKKVFLECFPDPGARSGRVEVAGEEDAGPRDAGVYREVVGFFSAGNRLELGDHLNDASYQQALESVPGLAALVDAEMAPAEEERHAAMELVLSGLYQCSFVARENLDRRTLYSDMLMRMFEGLRDPGEV